MRRESYLSQPSAVEVYVSYYTTYCNALNMWIKSVTKPGDLDQIQWGTKVPEEFQNEVLKDYMKTIASGGIA